MAKPADTSEQLNTELSWETRSEPGLNRQLVTDMYTSLVFSSLGRVHRMEMRDSSGKTKEARELGISWVLERVFLGLFQIICF